MRVYLDNNATTKCDEKTLQKMLPYFSENYGNPNSLHLFASDTHKVINEAINNMYEAINASEEDTILITTGATESINTVLNTIYENNIQNIQEKNIIISEVEHPATTATAMHLEKKGLNVRFLRVDDNGEIKIQELQNLIDENTLLVSVMWANNETGKIFPIKQISDICRKNNVPFHTDATQAIGKLNVDVQEIPVDYMSFSAHKFHGPKGVGGLYIKSNAQILPLIHGGEQMGGLRSGTLNTPLIVGLGESMKVSCDKQNLKTNQENISKLRDYLEDELLKNKDTILIGGKQNRTPNTSLISFRGVEGEAMLWDLNKNGIAASTGSACASEDLQANPVMNAFGDDSELAHTGIRFSLSKYTTKEQVDYAIEKINQAIKRLREISSTYSKGVTNG